MDTQKTVLEILESGMTQQALANLVPCAQSTINAFSQGIRGSRPSLAIGLRLQEIHKLKVIAIQQPRRRRKADQPEAKNCKNNN